MEAKRIIIKEVYWEWTTNEVPGLWDKGSGMYGIHCLRLEKKLDEQN